MYRHPRPHVLITNSDGKIITVQTCSIISTPNTYVAIHLKYETIDIKYQRLKQHFTCLVNWNECNDFTHTFLTLTCPSNQLKYINRPNRSSSTTPNLLLYHCPCTPSCGLPSVWNHTPGIPGRGLQSLSTRKRCIKILSTPLRLPFVHWLNCIILALNTKLVVKLFIFSLSSTAQFDHYQQQAKSRTGA